MVNQKKNVIHVDLKTSTTFCSWRRESESDTEFKEEEAMEHECSNEDAMEHECSNEDAMEHECSNEDTMEYECSNEDAMEELECILETGMDSHCEKKEIVSFTAQLPKYKDMTAEEIKILLKSSQYTSAETPDNFVRSHETPMYTFKYNGTYHSSNNFRVSEYKITLAEKTINNRSPHPDEIFFVRIGGEIIFVDKKNDFELSNDNIDVNKWIHRIHYLNSQDPFIQEIYPGYCEKSFVHLLFRYLNMTNKSLIKFLGMSKYDILTVYLENSWLNDQVINKYYSLIKTRDNTIEYSSTHVFDTYFWPRLYFHGHKLVKNDTKKIDIFSFKKLLFPINIGKHWLFVGVDFEKNEIVYYDSVQVSKQNCMFIIIQTICDYLSNEYEEKKKGKKFHRLVFYDGMSPLQTNSDDCGVFTCVNADLFSRNMCTTNYTTFINLHRQKIVSELLNMKIM